MTFIKTKDQKVLNNCGISWVSPTFLLKCVRQFCSRLYFLFLHYRETQCGGLGNIPFDPHACSLCCHEPGCLLHGVCDLISGLGLAELCLGFPVRIAISPSFQNLYWFGGFHSKISLTYFITEKLFFPWNWNRLLRSPLIF